MRSIRQLQSLLHAIAVLLLVACEPDWIKTGQATVSPALPSMQPVANLRRRAMNVPLLEPGTSCPITVTPGKQMSPDFGLAVGAGPIYAVTAGVGTLSYPAFAAMDAWQFAKVLWIGDPAYLGPVLIRGHQTDGPNELRFGGQVPQADLFFPEETRPEVQQRSPSGWRHWPSYTFARATGCYAYQVDGLDFSYHIVVQAIGVRMGAPP